MKSVLINRCRSARMPRLFVARWIGKLSKRKPFTKLKSTELVIVFVDPTEMRTLNKQYRGKDYPTDVLSFESGEDGVLGELVVCPQVLRQQALDTGLTYREELGYMIIHGALHLLGYDHETSASDAKKMFALQDQIFAKIR
jgi:probable rRNA maturation factor